MINKVLIKIAKKIPALEKDVRLFEIRRKVFHMTGVILPVLTLTCDAVSLLRILVIIIVPMVVLDYNNWLKFLFKFPKGSIFLRLLREHELVYGQLCGLTWLFFGYIIVLSCCDKYLVATAMCVLTFCDAMASLIGKNFGNIKVCEKTLEGFLAYILSGFVLLIVFLRYIVPYGTLDSFYLIVAVIISASAELIAKTIHIDDNFAIPVSFCFTYKVLFMVFG